MAHQLAGEKLWRIQHLRIVIIHEQIIVQLLLVVLLIVALHVAIFILQFRGRGLLLRRPGIHFFLVLSFDFSIVIVVSLHQFLLSLHVALLVPEHVFV